MLRTQSNLFKNRPIWFAQIRFLLYLSRQIVIFVVLQIVFKICKFVKKWISVPIFLSHLFKSPSSWGGREGGDFSFDCTHSCLQIGHLFLHRFDAADLSSDVHKEAEDHFVKVLRRVVWIERVVRLEIFTFSVPKAGKYPASTSNGIVAVFWAVLFAVKLSVWEQNPQF